MIRQTASANFDGPDARSDGHGTSMTPDSAPKRRRAIYTRKSTTDGLEQDFNSLDAQRGSCEAFIRSQPGWELIPEPYDDGGFTGANTDRPAFQRLLADVDARKIDIVVVYTVDRLSRSLLDFAKLMDRFAKAKAAFVSITQNFSTAEGLGEDVRRRPQGDRGPRSTRARIVTAASDGRLVYEGVISRRVNGARRVAIMPPPTPREMRRPLRVARMIALAHRCDALIAAGVVADRADLARVLGFTRSRMTQILALMLLAPDIQEQILVAEVDLGRDTITEHALRAIVRHADWALQRRLWRLHRP